jgi:hypothetical protein
MGSDTLVITDSNILVLMVITGLHKEICEAKHFGRIAVPPIIEEELLEWTAQGSKKRAKFGPLVDNIYELAFSLSEKETIIFDQVKLEAKKSQIKMVFRSLQNSGTSKLGAPPSDADSSILAIAMLTKSRLCTQEKTLRSLTLELTEQDPIGFVDLLEALILKNSKPKEEVLDALKNLDFYNEKLSKYDYERINKCRWQS